MNILITGATGLIGARLREALRARGHRVIGVARHPPAAADWIALDLAEATIADWCARLDGIDVVVNCVGIFRATARQRFDELHHLGPVRLFSACVRAGVGRVVQVSALGADAEAATPYHRSKRAADAELLAMPIDAVVVRPSLVFAPDGASSRLFLAWASLPLVPLPAGGMQAVQPVHIDDAIAALVLLATRVSSEVETRRPWALVGPRALTLADYLAALRAGMGLAPARTLAVPPALMRCAARLGDLLGRWWPALPLDSASWAMLERGNVGGAPDVGRLTALLGRSPRAPERFVAPESAAALRAQAVLGWLLPPARWSLAVVWIVTAWVAAFVWPVQDSLDLLARSGVPAALRPAALYGAAALDLVFGLATLWPSHGQRWRPWLWIAQAALIAFYTLVIALRLPEFWAHPYGPLTKNLPMLALIALVAALERRR